MPTATAAAPPAPLSYAPDLPFKYLGGDPSLDLVNTVDWTDEGLVLDRLTDYARLTRWAEGAGVIPARAAAQVRRRAEARPREARTALQAAWRARAVLRRAFEAVAAGRPAGPALEDLNHLLSDALRHLRLAPGRTRGAPAPAERVWRGMGEDLASPLWPVLWSAATLLQSDDATRLEICAGPTCGWMYVDRSRNHLRRWCEMATCGTREKSRRRSERRATT